MFLGEDMIFSKAHVSWHHCYPLGYMLVWLEPVSEAGNLVDLPNTICSGAYRWDLDREFLARQHISKASSNWDGVWKGTSWSILVSILLRKSPCRSILPFCQASVLMNTSIFCDCKNWLHWSDRNSPAGSKYMDSGGPAQLNHISLNPGMTWSVLCPSSRLAMWKPDASSYTWMT